MLLKTLNELGHEFEAIWASQRGRGSFVAAAYEFLAGADLPAFSWDEVEHETLRTGNHSEFGDLNLLPYQSEAFGIEVLVWGSGSPDIHSHSFSGAFRVVEGGSVHAVYSVDRTHWSSPQLVVADLSLRELSILRRGDTYPIAPGLDFLHGLYHWHDPAVTVVLRTKIDKHHPHQFGLPDPNTSPVVLATGRGIVEDPQLKAFRNLARLRPWHEVERVLHNALDELPVWRLWAIYSDVGSRLSHAARDAVLAALPAPLREVPATVSRPSILRQGRSRLRTDRARIAAGMMLLAPDRRRLLAALDGAFPGTDPLAMFARGAADVFDALLLGGEGQGVAEVVVRDVLACRSLGQSLDTLREEFEEDSLAEHERHIRGCRKIVAAHLARFAVPAKAPTTLPQESGLIEEYRT